MPLQDWTIFAVSALFVVAAGIAIGRISGELGARLKLGRAWSGAVLIHNNSGCLAPLLGLLISYTP